MCILQYSGGQYFRRQTQRPRQTCYEETPVYANTVTDSGNLCVYSVSAYIILFIYTHTHYKHINFTCSCTKRLACVTCTQDNTYKL